MDTAISFFGATDTVTGSRHLLEVGSHRTLVDCGLFQGPPEIRERNWKAFPLPPRQIDAVVLTHAHLDHTGYLPRLVRQGYDGPVFCTPATRDLLGIMLLDSARLQEEEAAHANRHGWSRHRPALALYDQEDAERCLRLLHPIPFGQTFAPMTGASMEFRHAGHILGSAFAWTETPGGTVLFSGDLGRYGQSIIPDPTPVTRADYLVLESTYGDRDHDGVDVLSALERIISRAVIDRAFVLVPSFAVERAQELLYLLAVLRETGRIPAVPVYLDSPMAVSATRVFENHPEEYDEEMRAWLRDHRSPFEGKNVHLVETREASKALNQLDGPGIIIAGSGMVNGGRIRHHLLNRISDSRNTVLFVGYQGVGTPGRRLLEGAPTFRAFGDEMPVRARIERLDALSAHADRSEILRWLGNFTQPPRCTFLVHGEPVARRALEQRIRGELGWNVERPDYADRFLLGEA